METRIPKDAREIEAVYTNCTHELDTDVVKELELNPNKTVAQHAAWEFCGYIWHDGTGWINEVWRHNHPMDIFGGTTVQEVIRLANVKYGSR